MEAACPAVPAQHRARRQLQAGDPCCRAPKGLWAQGILCKILPSRTCMLLIAGTVAETGTVQTMTKMVILIMLIIINECHDDDSYCAYYSENLTPRPLCISRSIPPAFQPH